MSPTFLTHFLLHLLKLMLSQMVTNYGDGGSIKVQETNCPSIR